MRRATSLAYLGALVLLSHALFGCVSEYTAIPEDLPDEAAPAVDAARATRKLITAPAREDLIARWQLPTSSPWLPYEKLTLPSVLAETTTPLWTPDIEGLGEVAVARAAAARVAEDGVPNDAAWFVDLAGAASIAFAATLTRYSPEAIAVIPTFNNWPAENALVPADETLAAMITSPPRLPEADDIVARPVFLLDSWRLAFKDERVDDGVIDNRYMLTRADFPTASVLRAQGIAQIFYLVSGDDVLEEEDDLHDLFASYEAAGIAICLIDLRSILRPRGAMDVSYCWYEQAHSRPFHAGSRETVVDDPDFYDRSQGGFGGAHLVSAPSGHMHHGSHGGG